MQKPENMGKQGEMVNLKRKLETQTKSEFNITPDVKISVEDGTFGRFVRLTRRTKWIAFSINLWDKVRQNLSNLKTSGFCLTLSDEKDVKVISFNDKTYVSFHRHCRIKDNIYDTYINLNQDEWESFLKQVDDINRCAFDGMGCNHCFGKKRKVVLYNGRMKKTNLTAEQFKSVCDSNMTAYNQLSHLCEFCGGTDFYDERCHCHKYDCKDCEPDNFCQACDRCLVAA